ncbi:HAMP domain-containing histidine kinase [Vibrio sp. S4M6]|uniref:sensor histidine kinase n=1 Tax=Vibrio sinus TaxID=2946865 RepID=UPI00202A25C6|nr:HAMP domain-containing sensor histidine kinase [Vibrio sinus]MCL9781325.1 HAMP domain-containing histidine kinase [Vibrio sinus]
MGSSFVLAIFLLLFASIKGLYVRKQQLKEKQFLLELLTHELRTPVASLGYTVELLRDQLSDTSGLKEHAVGRLISDHQRLNQITEISRAYISNSRKLQFKTFEADLSEWLDSVCTKYGLHYSLNKDIRIELPYYWLSICLENLIKNAIQHGKGEVKIIATVTDRICISVSDDGQFPSFSRRLVKIIAPKKSRRNMGIGLSVVSRLMRKLGGKLVIHKNPTRCVLEVKV